MFEFDESHPEQARDDEEELTSHHPVSIVGPRGFGGQLKHVEVVTVLSCGVDRLNSSLQLQGAQVPQRELVGGGRLHARHG